MADLAALPPPPADDRPPRDFPDEGSYAVIRSVGSLRVWNDRRWRWDGHDWQLADVSGPPADDQAARTDLAEAEQYVRSEAFRRGWRTVAAAHSEALTVVLAEYDRRAQEIKLLEGVRNNLVRAGDMEAARFTAELSRWAEKNVELAAHAADLSSLLRGMARRAREYRVERARELIAALDGAVKEMNAAREQVAAVRALADELDKEAATIEDWRRLDQGNDAQQMREDARRIRAVLNGSVSSSSSFEERVKEFGQRFGDAMAAGMEQVAAAASLPYSTAGDADLGRLAAAASSPVSPREDETPARIAHVETGQFTSTTGGMISQSWVGPEEGAFDAAMAEAAPAEIVEAPEPAPARHHTSVWQRYGGSWTWTCSCAIHEVTSWPTEADAQESANEHAAEAGGVSTTPAPAAPTRAAIDAARRMLVAWTVGGDTETAAEQLMNALADLPAALAGTATTKDNDHD